MKRLFVVTLFILLIASLMADVSIYGRVRTGAWFSYSDNYFTGGESVWDLNSKLYSSSNIGAKFNNEKINAKVEFGFDNFNGAYLRLAYAEYNFGMFKLLFGQDFTGFTSSNYSSQVNSVITESELGNIAYGAFYDGRKPMLKLTFPTNIQVILMQPDKIDPAEEGESALDALFPKLNLVYSYKNDNLYLSPTFGINFSKYNKNRNVHELDDSILAYAFAFNFKYKLEKICIKGQINYGQNIADYGISTLNNAYASYDYDENKVINSITEGGFLQVGFGGFVAGAGYSVSDNEQIKNPDASLDAFVQYNLKLSKKFCFTPEIGYINYLEDEDGNTEGSIKYFGGRLQATF